MQHYSNPQHNSPTSVGRKSMATSRTTHIISHDDVRSRRTSDNAAVAVEAGNEFLKLSEFEKYLKKIKNCRIKMLAKY